MDTTVASLRDGHLPQDTLGPLGVERHDLKAPTIKQEQKGSRVFLESAKRFMHKIPDLFLMYFSIALRPAITPSARCISLKTC